MSDEIDKALAGLTKKELIEVIRVIYPYTYFLAESINGVVVKVKTRSLRAQAEAAFARYEAVGIPDHNGDFGVWMAAIDTREKAFSEYMRLTDRADEIEFGTKMEDA